MLKAEHVLQHARFHRVKFGNAVTDANKRSYLRKIMQFEALFAAIQDSVGCISERTFVVELTEDRVVRQKVQQYAIEPREWLHNECERLCNNGTLAKIGVGEAMMQIICTIVLVGGTQSGQSYRMCYNGIELNTVTRLLPRHVPETVQCTDALGNANWFSLLDLKGAFHNIIMEQTSVKYLGFAT